MSYRECVNDVSFQSPIGFTELLRYDPFITIAIMKFAGQSIE